MNVIVGGMFTEGSCIFLWGKDNKGDGILELAFEKKMSTVDKFRNNLI